MLHLVELKPKVGNNLDVFSCGVGRGLGVGREPKMVKTKFGLQQWDK